MSKPSETLSGWVLAEQSDQPSTLRSPQERNLLQFNPFAAGLEEGPPSTKGRFRRVMTAISGSNGPKNLTNLTSKQLSQMSSTDSGENATAPFSTPDRKSLASAAGEDDAVDKARAVGGVKTAWKEENAERSGENVGLSNSSSISLDPATLRGKLSTRRPGRTRGTLDTELASDMVPSQISAQSNQDTLEHEGPSNAEEAGTERERPGNAVLRGVNAILIKTKSEDRNVIRKISGLLSRSKPGSPTSSQPNSKRELKLDVENEQTPRDRQGEKGIPVRKGSLLGRLGRKDLLPLRKRSLILSSNGMKRRNKSEDSEVETGRNRTSAEETGGEDIPPSEKDLTVTAMTAFQNDSVNDEGLSVTEDDLAKRAVQIEKFLNSVAFL